MKTTLYISVLLGALLIPTRSADVGDLQPIEVMMVSCENNLIRILTDTGDQGSGGTVAEAMLNLCDTTSGIVYPDLAEFLILDDGYESVVGELDAWLKPNTKTCMADQEIEFQDVASFLNAHKPAATLREVITGMKPEKLTQDEGKLTIKKD